MKKILLLLTLALFIGVISHPVLAQDPPKAKQETKKCEKKCEKADSTKCSKPEKAGCCKGEKKSCKK